MSQQRAFRISRQHLEMVLRPGAESNWFEHVAMFHPEGIETSRVTRPSTPEFATKSHISSTFYSLRADAFVDTVVFKTIQ